MIRWDLADAAAEDRPQGSLFDEPVFDREPGRGEFRGLEFLHVKARSIINEVKGGDGYLPFRYTINAYRGCSHSCSYCLAGETRVLLADGSDRPIAELRPGDRIIGTRRRRLVTTTVLDQWSTVRRAHRVVLEDGTAIVASAHHRFLTARGWQEVRGLRRTDSLLAVGNPAHKPVPCAETRATSGVLREVRVSARGSTLVRRGVVAVEPLGIDMPMYDITTGTGDFIADGVVSHNCFARNTHTYLGLDAGDDFDSKIVVKVNAVSLLRREIDPRRWAGEHIAMGTNTDPYQRCEGKYRLTRGIVEVLRDAANPFSILTKSTLVLRDLDLLAEAARRTDVRVNLSVGTLDDDVWRSTEPGTPHPRQRLKAVEALNAAGVQCGVLVAPILPGLSDGAEQLEEVATAAAEAGAVSVSTVLLHLRPGVKEVYLGRLARRDPELAATTARRYGTRVRLPKDAQRRVSDIVHAAVRNAGGLTAEPREARHLAGPAAERAAVDPAPAPRPPSPPTLF